MREKTKKLYQLKKELQPKNLGDFFRPSFPFDLIKLANFKSMLLGFGTKFDLL